MLAGILKMMVSSRLLPRRIGEGDFLLDEHSGGVQKFEIRLECFGRASEEQYVMDRRSSGSGSGSENSEVVERFRCNALAGKAERRGGVYDVPPLAAYYRHLVCFRVTINKKYLLRSCFFDSLIHLLFP
jgi:hypothetical protein